MGFGFGGAIQKAAQQAFPHAQGQGSMQSGSSFAPVQQAVGAIAPQGPMQYYQANQGLIAPNRNTFQTQIPPQVQPQYQSWLQNNQHIPQLQNAGDPYHEYDVPGLFQQGQGDLRRMNQFATPYNQRFSPQSQYHAQYQQP